MNIAIPGMGNIGGTMGKKWAATGHTITNRVGRAEMSISRIKP